MNDKTHTLDELIEEIRNMKWYHHLYYKIMGHLHILRPTIIYYKLKRLYQRWTRGWDDSETWSLDDSFYKWLRPRLKRFYELTNGYPSYYKTFEDWQKELEKRIVQLDMIMKYKYNERDFQHYEYFDAKVIAEMFNITEEKALEYFNDNKSYFSFYCCENDFLKWFSRNINHLWW